MDNQDPTIATVQLDSKAIAANQVRVDLKMTNDKKGLGQAKLLNMLAVFVARKAPFRFAFVGFTNQEVTLTPSRPKGSESSLIQNFCQIREKYICLALQAKGKKTAGTQHSF